MDNQFKISRGKRKRLIKEGQLIPIAIGKGHDFQPGQKSVPFAYKDPDTKEWVELSLGGEGPDEPENQ